MATEETDPALKRGSYGWLSLRHVAVEAGMGTLGLEVNLLTPEFGPRVYNGAVVTDAPLEPDPRITDQLCIGESCGRCLLCCPTNAVLHWGLDKRKCALAAQPDGVASIIYGPLRELAHAASDDAVRRVVDGPAMRKKWAALVRLSNSYAACPRCLEVCPVGGDYQRHLAREHREIPEKDAARVGKLADMKAAAQAGAAPTTRRRSTRAGSARRATRGSGGDRARHDDRLRRAATLLAGRRSPPRAARGGGAGGDAVLPAGRLPGDLGRHRVGHVMTAAGEVLLRTEQLTRAFGSLLAVDRVDVAVRRGELRSIIGPNGAGKTTFFRLISGEMAPTGGRIWFDGRDITGLPQHRVARLGVAKSYQITNVFPHLTVLENVRVAAQGYRHAYDFWSKASRLTGAREQAQALPRASGSAGRPRGRPRTCPTARSGISRSGSRWPPGRRCCSSTSRRPA